jgi:DNA-binding LytR/AlgR family response regulator
MIHIAIVDDELNSQQLLFDYLHRYEIQNNESFEISIFFDGKEIAANYIPQYDIILLDVKMDSMSGFTAAERIRKLDNDVVIIFITNLAQYAIEGYKVDALNYLLKPVSYFTFSEEIKRSLKRVRNQEKSYLTIPIEQGFVRVDVKKILFIESEKQKHRILIHTDDAGYSMVCTLREMESKLQSKNFLRCNSGYLVNLARVIGVQGNFVLVGKHRLQISRPKKKGFLSMLTDYLGGAKR